MTPAYNLPPEFRALATLPERPRLLVVDDQPINIQTLYQIFHVDHEVFMATSGEQALAFCRDNVPPDLILLDVVMPGMDGIETCRRLKADPTLADIPVIFVTARSEPADETGALTAGGVDFIAKPVNPAVVRARVKTHLTLKTHKDHLEQLVKTRTAALSIAKEAAEAANRAKTSFLATMSHELRTPLNAIMGLTRLALRLDNDAKLNDYLARIDKSSHQLLRLIDDILDYTRVEGARLTLEQGEFRLDEILEHMEDQISPQAAAKGLMLQVEPAPELVGQTLQGDRTRLEQILLELVGNAIKFTVSGSVAIRVAQSRETKENITLRIEIQDTGIGIASADRQRIFAPFVQVDDSLSRQYGGTGLGLALCKRLIQAMGGEMGVDSVPGQGSNFWFTMTLAKAATTS